MAWGIEMVTLIRVEPEVLGQFIPQVVRVTAGINRGRGRRKTVDHLLGGRGWAKGVLIVIESE
jgi:hypothetical protein